MPARPHVLYIAWGFPPSRAGGVYRALATANALARHGFDVTVLTVERESFVRMTGVDDSLLEHIDQRIVVERLPFDYDLPDADISTWPRARARNPARWLDRQEERGSRFPEVRYGLWAPELADAAERIHRSRRVDLTIATANPNVTFHAAYHLHRLADVPYVLDHRDAWRLNVITGEASPGESPLIASLEKQFMGSALEVWFVNEPIRRWHQAEYPERAERMHVVMNGYDPGLSPPPLPGRPLPPDAPLRFGYLGTAGPAVPLPELVAGWRLARAGDPVLTTSEIEVWGRLGFYTTPDPDWVRLFETAGQDSVTYQGPVSKGSVTEVYQRFDVLLLALAGSRYVTSGKVFEYMATGLPILAVHEPDHAVSDVLDGYPLSYAVRSLEPEAIAQGLKAVSDDRARWTPEARRSAHAFATRFERSNQLTPRVQALRDMFGDPR